MGISNCFIFRLKTTVFAPAPMIEGCAMLSGSRLSCFVFRPRLVVRIVPLASREGNVPYR